MAKKNSNAPSRKCLKCGESYHTRRLKCPVCGTGNPSYAHVSRPVPPTFQQRSPALDAALDLIEAAGGLDQAAEMLEKLRRVK